MRKYLGWFIVGGIALLVTLLGIWTSAQTRMIPNASEAWSRGWVVGQTPVRRAVALHPLVDGGCVLIWQNLGEQLQMVRVDRQGEVVLDEVLAVGASQPRDPQLEVGADGRLHVLWREGEHPDSALYYVLLDEDGMPVRSPEVISEAPIEENPRLVAGGDGRYHAVWADDQGIQWAVLSAEGALLEGPTLLVPEAGTPSVQLDDQGHLHLAWRWEQRAHVWKMSYAVLTPADGSLRGPVELEEIILRSGQGLDDPVIGLDKEQVRVFWIGRDFKYGGSWSDYVAFPVDAPEAAKVGTLTLSEGRSPVDVYATSAPGAHLWLAVSESVPDAEVMDVDRSQIGVMNLSAERDETLVTTSPSASLLPVLAIDEAGQQYLAWLETAEFGRYRVVYASTAPRVVENYNAWTLADIVDTAFINVFKISTLVVALVAVLIMWAVIPLLVLVVYHLFTSEETLYSLRSYIALFVVLALEVFLTFAVPPRLAVGAGGPLLRWGAPTVGVLVAVLVTLKLMRRRERPHMFGIYFLFTGISSGLQMLIYLLI